MAEAFAAGEWAEAFHPRFGVGFPVLSGTCVFLSGCDGYAACSAIAALAWALGAIPVFRLASRVFDRRTAWFALILYAICPQPYLWALKGLREPFKLLGVLLMADGVVRSRDGSGRTAVLFEMCAGLALMFLFKCDAILLGGLLALAFAFCDGWSRRTWMMAASGALALQPMCFVVWEWTGWWLPAPHYVTILEKVFGG